MQKITTHPAAEESGYTNRIAASSAQEDISRGERFQKRQEILARQQQVQQLLVPKDPLTRITVIKNILQVLFWIGASAWFYNRGLRWFEMPFIYRITGMFVMAIVLERLTGASAKTVAPVIDGWITSLLQRTKKGGIRLP